jgi:hypothetical protein
MENINTTDYYFKAEKVIMTCETTEQLRASLKYAELYYNLTKDKSGYEVLVRKFHKLYSELKLDEEAKNS